MCQLSSVSASEDETATVSILLLTTFRRDVRYLRLVRTVHIRVVVLHNQPSRAALG